jgi:putative transposase
MAASCLALSAVDVRLRPSPNIALQCIVSRGVVPEVPAQSNRGRMEVCLKEIITTVITDEGAWFDRGGDNEPRAFVAVYTQIGVHQLPSLWTNSYFVAAAGIVRLSVIKRHVETQKDR